MGGKPIAIGSSRLVGRGHATVVVAEIGQNHNGSAATAEELIDAAAWAGADAVKLVKRDIKAELSLEARDKPYDGRNAFGATYGEHRRALELPEDVHAALCRRARRHGLLFMGTACDPGSMRLFASLGADALKIASRDLANTPLLHRVGQADLPILLSTGMSSFAEIDVAVGIMRRHGTEFALLHCTSLYPTPSDQVHLRSLTAMASRYDVPVGFSDHTAGILMAPVAVSLGAVMVEKHLTLDRQQRGTDHACSLEPEPMRTMIGHIRQVEAALGRDDKPVARGVEYIRTKLGRSLVVNVPVAPGTRLEEEMLSLKCPGDGLAWRDRHLLVGRPARRQLAADEKLSLDDVC